MAAERLLCCESWLNEATGGQASVSLWFERLMGFPETSPDQVRANIDIEGQFLISRVNGRRVRCGRLATPSLAELRADGKAVPAKKTTVTEVVGDIGQLHRDSKNAGTLFQAASQFNLLEMAGPSVTPEKGVGIYQFDRTQGPACAIACGGGTIFRNYFAPVGRQIGQSAEHQIDCLADLHVGLGGPGLWEMRNGYAFPSRRGFERINAGLAAASPSQLDYLRGMLRVGVQHDVEVTDTDQLVTQVYGSALPVGYGSQPTHLWEPLARLVLEASYEATLRVARRCNIDIVYLTLLGGGVFRNDSEWISESILSAVERVDGLDARIVSYEQSNKAVKRLIDTWEGVV